VTLYVQLYFTAVHVKATETQKYLRYIKINGRKDERRNDKRELEGQTEDKKEKR
jgi:hypothetical protein